MDPAAYLNHGTNLSAEVEPFIPRSDIGNMMAEHMLPQTSQGSLPHYLTSCYPFVQDQNTAALRRDRLDYQNYYSRWPQGPPASNPQFQQHVAPPNRFSAPLNQAPPPASLPHPSTPIYTYHTGPQYPYPGVSQAAYQSQFLGTSAQQAQYSAIKTAHGKRENGKSGRRSDERKQTANKKGQRSVGVQMDVKKAESNKEEGPREMVDNTQQTDFPSEIASKTLAEKPSPLKNMTRTGRKWRRANKAADHSASCESSDNNGVEADVDSDSGYYSPKLHMSRRNHALSASGGGAVRDDRQEIGTAIHPNYPSNDLSRQGLLYLSAPPPNHPSAYYQVHPGSYLGPPSAPGQIIRLPTSGTPPMIMTPPPPMMNLAQGVGGHHNQAIAMANFKSRSAWEQEILKAHNVAPICPPPFVPRQQAPYGQHRNRGGGPHNWRHPRFQNSRQQQRGPPASYGRPNPGSGDLGTGAGNMAQDWSRPGHGILKLNPSTAPQHLIQQTPPQLTDEDFPDLRPASGTAGPNAHPLSSFSYSAVLQNKAKPAPEMNIFEDSPIKSLIEPDDSGSGKGSRRRRKKTERAAKAAAEEYAEISKEQENIKKQLNKKKAKSKTPQLDLAAMLSKLEQTQPDTDRGPAKQHAQTEAASSYKLRVAPPLDSHYLMPHNPLDSSAPMKKRGKEREVPKVKKPSALKKVILKEREEKKNTRLTTLTNEEAPEYDIPSVPADYFKSEHVLKESSPENNVSDGVSTSEPNGSDNPSPLTVSVSGNSSPVVPANIPKIHSRRYREYCSGQVLDKLIDEECIVILQKLVQFQERMYLKDPIKAKSKRRFVLGIREVTKHLKLKKLRCVFVSPNLEKIQSKGGLDDALQLIMQLCKTQSVPYVFALGRCAMGRAVSKLVPVSIIGIFDYSGAEDSFKKMLDLVKDAQNKYHEMMMMYQQEIVEAAALPPTAPHAQAKRFAHMGHSRNPSAASCVSFCSMISEPISEMNPLEGTSWRNIMDVTDEENPAPALSPPPEHAQEDELENEASAEETKDDDSPSKDVEKINDVNQEDYEDAPSDANEDSYQNAVENNESLTSDERQTVGEPHLDKSFSTVSTVVPRPSKDEGPPENGKPSLSSKPPGSENVITSITEEALPSSSDTEARINSWLASSVQDPGIEDSPAEKLERIEEDEKDQEEDDDDDFVSTHEDEIEDSQE